MRAAARHQRKILLTALMIIPVLIALFWFAPTRNQAFHDGCLPSNRTSLTPSEFMVCATSDMAKPHRYGAITLEHTNFDLAQGKPLRLQVARNETVAFQLITKRANSSTERKPNSSQIDSSQVNSSQISVGITPWAKNGSTVKGHDSPPLTTYFAAHYHLVDKGGYQWGPKTNVLDWPNYYPDALIPQDATCDLSFNSVESNFAENTPGPTQNQDSVKSSKTKNNKKPIFETIDIEQTESANQSIWFDVYVPEKLAVGEYHQMISLAIDAHTVLVPVQLTVRSATLPDKPTVNAIGETYRTYRLEGVGESVQSLAWQQMSHCYQQLAHQHRTVFIERVVTHPDHSDWDAYLQTITPMLTGELFTDKYGYYGTGAATPVSVWRTPWEQEVNVERLDAVNETLLKKIEFEAKAWQKYIQSINRDDESTHHFAYIFDEVDGPDAEADAAERRDYISSVHDDMDKIQKAIDSSGEVSPRIDLLWTSHSNPSIWQNEPELDLTGKIRFWAPNASAADIPFLKDRQNEGDKIWFYHSGHPAIGAHSINASGIEMRTWGTAAARYGFDGQFMWAVNLGSDERPFAEPSYRPNDDRFGNGVLVYPGNQLNKIGYRATPGPIPSMRLKAWRRGLQDAELINLVRQFGSQEQVTAMENSLKEIMPRALGEGRGRAAWSQDAGDWIAFREMLLDVLDDQLEGITLFQPNH